MSHTILYNRLFIKLKDGSFIPLVQAGDNNVYDIDPLTGREKRSRDWEGWIFGKRKTSYTREEIYDYLNERRASVLKDYQSDNSEQDIISHYGWFKAVTLYGKSCSTTSFSAYSNFFLKGMENAISFEEFVGACGGLQVTRWDEDKHGMNFSRICLTEEDLKKTFDETIKETNDVWIVPGGRWFIEHVAALCGPSAKKGVIANATYIDGEGKRVTRTVKSIFPLQMTNNPLMGRRFTKGEALNHLFKVLDKQLKKENCDLRQISYEGE